MFYLVGVGGGGLGIGEVNFKNIIFMFHFVASKFVNPMSQNCEDLSENIHAW